jgi:16S rRNA processing protein RimM
VGRIVKPFGVRGEVIVDPTGEDPARFARGERLFVESVGDEALQVGVSRFRTGSVTVAFEGIVDRDQAEQLVGVVLHQDVDKLPGLPEGAYYHFQLVGLTVFREDGTLLGEVLRVHELPASDVLEVRGAEHEWMIPRRDEFIASIDIEAGRIVLSARDDLLEAVGHARVPKESPGKIRRRAREEARKKAWEAREAKREEQRKADERATAEREARELDVSEWNSGSLDPRRGSASDSAPEDDTAT